MQVIIEVLAGLLLTIDRQIITLANEKYRKEFIV